MTGRGFLSWKIHDAIQRLGASTTLEAKLHWARVLNDAKRERGDFENTRPPCAAESHQPNGASASAVDQQGAPSAAARVPQPFEAYREAADLPGERYD